MTTHLSAATDRELALGVLVVIGLTVFVAVRVLKRLFSEPLPPDPWSPEVSAKIERSNALMICNRCLVPNSPEAEFCENCGATIGQYTNYQPLDYIFTFGHTLRLGTAGDYKRSPLTVIGYILLALSEYLVFAPIYLYQLFRKLPAKR